MANIRDTYELNTSPAVNGLDKLAEEAARSQDRIEELEKSLDRLRNMANAEPVDSFGASPSAESIARWMEWNEAQKRVPKEIAAAEKELAKEKRNHEAILKQIKKAQEEVTKEQKREEREARKAIRAQKEHVSVMQRLSRAIKDSHTPLDGVMKRLTRMGLFFFSTRRLIRYMINAMERAPEEIAAPFQALKQNISDGFARPFVALLDGMKSGIEKLNAALASDAGQKFMRGLETVGRSAGAAIGFLFDKLATLVEFLGNNFQSVMSVAIILATIFAAKMIAAGIATMIAHWPLLLIIGAILGIIGFLRAMGVTWEQIFGFIGGLVGAAYAWIYNRIADLWNYIAIFVEFFANVFNDPIGSIVRLFSGFADYVLGILEKVAKGIDWLFGSNLADTISGWRSGLSSAVEEKFGKPAVEIARMEYKSYGETISNFAQKGAGFAGKLSDSSLANTPMQEIADNTASTDGNVASIKKAVTMAEEDLKMLVDMAERRFINQVNLTSQAPVINVQGQNTGNSEADRRALADTLAAVLMEQFDAGSTVTTAKAF